LETIHLAQNDFSPTYKFTLYPAPSYLGHTTIGDIASDLKLTCFETVQWISRTVVTAIDLYRQLQLYVTEPTVDWGISLLTVLAFWLCHPRRKRLG